MDARELFHTLSFLFTDCNFNDNVSENFQKFTACILEVTDKHVPYKSLNLSHKRTIKPWITKELEALIQNRQKLYRLYRKRPLTYGGQYGNFRNLVNRKLDLAKREYYRSKLKSSFGNGKKSLESD